MSASTEKKFNSQVKLLGDFKSDFTQDQIKNEPMFFNCNVHFAYQNGSDITKSFLDSLPIGWSVDSVIDTRVHMLMPGWYPAIPGYHHDDVPRKEIPTGQHFITAGQPDYDNPRYLSEHLMGLVNSEVCPTSFALGECVMPKINEGELIYREWHKEVEILIENGSLNKWYAQSGKIIQFDWQTFHSCQRSVKNGWRWFCRISRNTDRVNNINNEIRKQVQVYMEFPMEGW